MGRAIERRLIDTIYPLGLNERERPSAYYEGANTHGRTIAAIRRLKIDSQGNKILIAAITAS